MQPFRKRPPRLQRSPYLAERHSFDVRIKKAYETPQKMNLSFQRQKVGDATSKHDNYKIYLEKQFSKARRRYQQTDNRNSSRSSYQQLHIPLVRQPGKRLVQGLNSRHQRADSFKIRTQKHKKMSSQIPLSSVNTSRIPSPIVDNLAKAHKLFQSRNYIQALLNYQLCDQQNVQVCYFQGVIYLQQRKYNQALQQFTKVISKSPTFKPNLYVLAATCAKNMSQTDQAIQLCQKGLKITPNHYGLHLCLGKLFKSIGRIEDAHIQFQKGFQIDQNSSGQALLLDAQCLYTLGLYSKCLAAIYSALSLKNAQNQQKLIILRLKINLQHHNVQQARKDISLLNSIIPNTSIIQFYKGLVAMQSRDKKYGILSFQKCIRLRTDQVSASLALVQITKSKINDKDFYSAYHHISRAKHIQLHHQMIDIFRLFCQGVVLLMKKKISQGVQNLQHLKMKQPQLDPFLAEIFDIFMAYGHLMQDRHQQAIADYRCAQLIHPLNKYNKYNLLIAKGVYQTTNLHFTQAKKCFDEAAIIIQSNSVSSVKVQSYIYRAAVYFQQAKHAKLIIKNEQRMAESLLCAMHELDRGHELNENNSNLLYVRALLQLYLGRIEQALNDLVAAMTKAEENIAKYFFLKAIIQMFMGSQKQSLKDLNICLTLDQNFSLAYFQRAKIYYLTQNQNKGKTDLLKYCELVKGENIYQHQCCFLLQNKMYIEAQKLIQNLSNCTIKKDILIHISLKTCRFDQAYNLMDQKIDKQMCLILQQTNQEQEIKISHSHIFSPLYQNLYAGVHYLQVRLPKLAYKYLKQAQDICVLGGLDNDFNDEKDKVDEQPINLINYNIFLCHMMLGQFKKAYQVFMKQLLPLKDHIQQQNLEEFYQMLFALLKGKPEINSKSVYQIHIFTPKLADITRQISIDTSHFTILSKPCLILPYPNDLLARYHQPLTRIQMLNLLSIKEVQTRPEPPWVRRQNKQILVFTDEIKDISIKFETTLNDQQDDQVQQQQQQQINDNQQNQDEDNQLYKTQQDEYQSQQQSQSVKANMQRRQFMAKIKLNQSIQRKLQKIMDKH